MLPLGRVLNPLNTESFRVNRCGTESNVDGIEGRGLRIVKYKSCLS